MLLFQGAEARVFSTVNAVGDEVVVKERLAKAYRAPELDAKINKARVKSEVKNMLRAAKLGVDVPRVDHVDKEMMLLVMELVRGRALKLVVNDPATSVAAKEAACRRFGEELAALHAGGMAHGDPTTSNAIVREGASASAAASAAASASAPTSPPGAKVALIDFGLAYGTTQTEDLGVDLYVLERAFLSSHPGQDALFAACLAAYFAALESKSSHARVTSVRKAFEEVRLRGRKRLAFG